MGIIVRSVGDSQSYAPLFTTDILDPELQALKAVASCNNDGSSPRAIELLANHRLRDMLG